MTLKEKIEKILNQARDEYWGTSEVTYEKVVGELTTLFQSAQKEAIEGFVKKGTEIQQDLAENGVIANIGLVYEEYLKTLDGSAEKHETPKRTQVCKCCKCGREFKMPSGFMGTILCEDCDPFMSKPQDNIELKEEFDNKWFDLSFEVLDGDYRKYSPKLIWNFFAPHLKETPTKEEKI